jgi:hypothetical protein
MTSAKEVIARRLLTRASAAAECPFLREERKKYAQCDFFVF